MLNKPYDYDLMTVHSFEPNQAFFPLLWVPPLMSSANPIVRDGSLPCLDLVDIIRQYEFRGATVTSDAPVVHQWNFRHTIKGDPSSTSASTRASGVPKLGPHYINLTSTDIMQDRIRRVTLAYIDEISITPIFQPVNMVMYFRLMPQAWCDLHSAHIAHRTFPNVVNVDCKQSIQWHSALTVPIYTPVKLEWPPGNSISPALKGRSPLLHEPSIMVLLDRDSSQEISFDISIRVTTFGTGFSSLPL